MGTTDIQVNNFVNLISVIDALLLSPPLLFFVVQDFSLPAEASLEFSELRKLLFLSFFQILDSFTKSHFELRKIELKLVLNVIKLSAIVAHIYMELFVYTLS